MTSLGVWSPPWAIGSPKSNSTYRLGRWTRTSGKGRGLLPGAPFSRCLFHTGTCIFVAFLSALCSFHLPCRNRSLYLLVAQSISQNYPVPRTSSTVFLLQVLSPLSALPISTSRDLPSLSLAGCLTDATYPSHPVFPIHATVQTKPSSAPHFQWTLLDATGKYPL